MKVRNLSQFMTSLYPSVVERYFTKYYYKGENNQDTCVLAHSNRICIVTLAPDHPILKEGSVKEVSFNPNGKDFHLSNKIHGKKKKGAIKVSPSTVLCAVTSNSGKSYYVQCGVKGSLMEMNENLLRDPSLLINKHETKGYVAIVHHDFYKEIGESLLTEDEYNALKNNAQH